MNSQSHPILIELSKNLPETSITYKYIHGPQSFEQVAIQAREETFYLNELETGNRNGSSSRVMLVQNGYENWLNEMENDEDRLRLIGCLRLIIELAEELAEE